MLFHHPRGQANPLKTRAQRSYILYNLIDEEATGYGSYEINIAQGGLNVIMGNVIIQGSSGANHSIIGYDAALNPLEDFYFINNTVINKYAGNVKYFNIAPASGINTFKVYNNIFASVNGASNTMFGGNIPGALDTSNNLVADNYLAVGFTDPSVNEYTLLSAAPAINAGTYAGTTNTAYPLLPLYMYKAFDSSLMPRTITAGIIDIGAYEYTTSTLPLKLLGFTATIDNLTSLLTWKTGSEMSTWTFVIERSANGSTWTALGNIIAMNTPGNHTYSFRDKEPMAGINYYRLKMVDKDGRFTYSPVKVLDFKGRNETITIVPNPAGNYANIVFSKPITNAVVTVIDANGRKVISETVKNLNSGIYQLNTEILAVGIYVLEVKADQINVSLRLVIQK